MAAGVRPGALGKPGDFGVHVLVGRLNRLAPRDVVDHERAPDGVRRCVPLPEPELAPVDLDLHRVDPLFDQPADELLQPAVHFLLDQHVGRGGHPRRELLDELVPHRVLGLLLGAALQFLADAIAQRLERLDVAHFLRKLVVERQQLLLSKAFDGDRVIHSGAGQLGGLVVRRVVDRELPLVADRRAHQPFVEPGRVGRRANLDRHVLQRLRLAILVVGRRWRVAGQT